MLPCLPVVLGEANQTVVFGLLQAGNAVQQGCFAAAAGTEHSGYSGGGYMAVYGEIKVATKVVLQSQL